MGIVGRGRGSELELGEIHSLKLYGHEDGLPSCVGLGARNVPDPREVVQLRVEKASPEREVVQYSLGRRMANEG